MKNLKHLFIFSLLLSSCVTQKDWVYFHENSTVEEKIPSFELRYQPNDLLSINITAIDMDAAMPFNLYVTKQTNNRLVLNGQSQQQTYLVDEKGEINFPVLGKLRLGGLSRKEATDLIEAKLEAYLKDPLATIRLTNYRVSVLGEVNKPGTYLITNEQVSLPEAIALAGDLSINGRRTNILLIRKEGEVLTKNYIDLTSDSFLNSTYYFLKPNDVLYIEPNKAKIRSSTDALRFTSISLSVITTLTTIASILLR